MYCLSYSERKRIVELTSKLHLRFLTWYLDLLGDELTKNGNPGAALVCYLIGRNMPKVMDLWRKKLDHLTRARPHEKNHILRIFFEKTLIYKTLIQFMEPNEHVDHIVAEFSAFLAHEGLKDIPLKYLDILASNKGEAALILKDRIFNSDSRRLSQLFSRPVFPYRREELKVPQRGPQQKQRTPQNNPGMK